MAKRLEQLSPLKRYLDSAEVARRMLHAYRQENQGNYGKGDPNDIEFFTRMSLWYSLLYVVWEGWKRMRTDDDQYVELSNAAQAALKDFRDKTFHAQPKFPPKELISYAQREDSVSIAYKLEAQPQFAIDRAIKSEQDSHR